MNRTCAKDELSPIYIASLVVSQRGPFTASLVIPMPESSDSCGGEKNCLWRLRYVSAGLL